MAKTHPGDRLRTVSLTIAIAPIAICAAATIEGQVILIMDEATAHAKVSVPLIRRKLKLDSVKQKAKKPAK